MEMIRIHKNFHILHQGINDKHEALCKRLGYGNLWNTPHYEKAVQLLRDLYAQKNNTTFSFDVPSDPHHAFGPWFKKLEALKILESDTSDEAFSLVATEIGIDFDPVHWQQAYTERGANGLKPLAAHSDMSLSRYFSHEDPIVAERAKAVWRERYPAMHWGVAPLRGGKPSGIKSWAWGDHVDAWQGHMY